MKKGQIKIQAKKGFQAIPFFIALGFALPIHTAVTEIDSTSVTRVAQITNDHPAPTQIDRKPAQVRNQISNTGKLIGMNLKLNESALIVQHKNWQIDETTIDLLHFSPENEALGAYTETSIADN